MITDEQLDVVEGYKEYIHHEAEPANEQGGSALFS
jgi:hypothetical protein